MTDFFAALLTSYGSSSGLSLIIHIIAQSFKNTQKLHEMHHKETMARIAQENDMLKHVYANVSERDTTQGFWHGSFFGWSRRIVNWVVVFSIFGGLLWAVKHNAPINLVFRETHHFLWFTWQSTRDLVVHGMVITPFMRDLLGAIIGLYSGPATVKKMLK